MKLWTSLMCAVAVLVFVAAPILAADTPKAEAKKDAPKAEAKADAPKAAEAAKPALEGDLAILARETKLSDEQQVKVLEAVAVAKAEMTAWETKNKAKIDAFRAAGEAAQKAQDQAAFTKAMTEFQPLRDEIRALRAKHEEAILGILTPEQKMTWMGFVIGTQLNAQLQALGLTPEQQSKVRALSEAAAKELVAVKGSDEAAQKARVEIQAKLFAGIRESVLTAEQKAKITPPAAAPAPAMPGAAAPAPAAPAPAAPAPAAPAKK